MSFKHVSTVVARTSREFADALSSSLSTYQITNLSTGDIEQVLRDIVKDALDKERVEALDYVQVYVDGETLQDPIVLNKSFVPANEFPYEDISTMIENVGQSSGGLVLSSELSIKVYHIKRPHGSGKRGTKTSDPNQLDLYKKIRFSPTHYVTIDTDKDCFAKSLIYGIRLHDDKDDIKSRDGWMYKGKITTWKTKGNAELVIRSHVLMWKCGLTPGTPVGPEQWGLFHNYLTQSGFRICVFNKIGSILHTQTYSEGCKNVCLILYNNHYYPVWSPAFGYSRFCKYCLVGYEVSHKCQIRCEYCRRTGCFEHPLEEQTCQNCQKSCRNQECLRWNVNVSWNVNRFIDASFATESCLRIPTIIATSSTVEHAENQLVLVISVS